MMMGRGTPKTTHVDEIKLKHLDYIQGVVARMAHSSAQAKSWLLPVVTATFGYALTQRSGTVAMLGIAAILLFGYMDANYLRQERAYRRLYNAVVAGKEIPELSLDPSDIDRNIPDADGDLPLKTKDNEKMSCWKKVQTTCREWFLFDSGVWFSWSIFPFYGGFLVVGIVVLCYAIAH